MILGAGIYLIDIAGMHGPLTRFGIIYGSNAIAVYVLADILAIVFYGIRFGGLGLNEHFFNVFTSAGAGPKMASMIYALVFVFINFIPALILFRKKILIKL
jgi:predicted acyltransferase